MRIFGKQVSDFHLYNRRQIVYYRQFCKHHLSQIVLLSCSLFWLSRWWLNFRVLACCWEKRLLATSYLSFLPSVWPSEYVSLPPRVLILLKLGVECFTKICLEIPNVIKIRQISGTLHIYPSNFYSCWWHMIDIDILLTVFCNLTTQNKCTITFFVKVFNIDYIVNIAYFVHNESPKTKWAYNFLTATCNAFRPKVLGC